MSQRLLKPPLALLLLSLVVPALSWVLARPHLQAHELRALALLFVGSLFPAAAGALWALRRTTREKRGRARGGATDLCSAGLDHEESPEELNGAQSAKVRKWVALNRDFQLALDAYQALEERLGEIESQVGDLAARIEGRPSACESRRASFPC